MKQNLGKYILFILSTIVLQAEDFSYTFHIDKPQPYVKEAVFLVLDVNQTNPDIVLLFDFDLKKSKDYSFQRIGIQEVDVYHAVQIRYTYLLYPLRSGTITIDFALTQKTTTDDSVAYSFSGDRDNVKGLVTKDSNILLPTQTLEVKSLPKGTQIVGDFSLDYRIAKHKAKAYEVLPFEVSIKGDGYPPLLHTLTQKDANFTVFTEQPHINHTNDTKGTHSLVTYTMALSHHQSFILPKITLNAFNPKIQKSYVLTIPSQTFDIKEVKQNALLDKVDAPAMLTTDLSWLRTLATYLVIFTAGYLTAHILKTKRKAKKEAMHPLLEKISQTSEPKALLQLLMAHDSYHFSAIIEKLEGSLYGDGKINLAQVKKEAMDLL